MKMICMLLSIICLSLQSAEPEREEVILHPLLAEEPPKPVEITLSFDPKNIPVELAHLVRYLGMNGAQCEVKHDDPSIVGKVWCQISSEIDDFSYKYPRREGDKPFRLLSLDGGGIRGLITCLFLSHLTHITGKPVHELFDMIVATSTGTLIAAGLGTLKTNTAPIQVDYSLLPYKDSIPSPYFSPEELAALYLTDGKTIFSGSGGWFGGWNGPKYSDSGLNSVLMKYFKNTILSDLGIPVVLTSYDLHMRTLHPFQSFDDTSSDHGVFVREAIRACVAAPTFFTPVMVYKQVLCDAGIVKNNPTSLGIAIAAEHYKVDPRALSLLSLGCGHCVDAKSLSVYQGMGIKGWAEELLSGVLDGQVDHEIISMLHRSGAGPSNYLRISPLMRTELMSTDETAPANFSGLINASVHEIMRRYKDFARMAGYLTDKEILAIKPEFDSLRSRAVPLDVREESAPVLPGVSTHPLIQQSVSSPVLPSVGQPQQSQTEQEVSGDGSTLPAQEHDQLAS